MSVIPVILPTRRAPSLVSTVSATRTEALTAIMNPIIAIKILILNMSFEIILIPIVRKMSAHEY